MRECILTRDAHRAHRKECWAPGGLREASRSLEAVPGCSPGTCDSSGPCLAMRIFSLSRAIFSTTFMQVPIPLIHTNTHTHTRTDTVTAPGFICVQGRDLQSLNSLPESRCPPLILSAPIRGSRGPNSQKRGGSKMSSHPDQEGSAPTLATYNNPMR